MRPAPTDDRPVIVFDLGGTWWRSAILTTDNRLADQDQHEAVTKARTGSNAATLRDLMVKYLLGTTRRLMERQPDLRTVGISIGAATNGHTGQVLASAPLWGDCTDPYDLRAALAGAAPGLDWWVVNDVTSLALAITARQDVRESGLRVITAVTVSSGIAARTVDVVSGEIPLDRQHGVQGEIGHLPALVTVLAGVDLPVCDCGAVGHVSAIAAGKAIERLLSQLAGILGIADDSETGAVSHLEHLRTALEAHHPSAMSFLDYVTAPLARALLYLLAIDARVDHIFLSGGVVDALQDHYMNSLYRTMEADGLYLVSTYQPSVFRDRISRWESDGLDPLRGAGFFARQQSLPASARYGGRRH
ncbi:ROK family protein [Nocardia transvalensis]|uniref:ROK family protein n=1 Tax=Nocardia transvalensis TaxID=37333 RepID=UPI0018937F10|nr:ROK family protein [Nocardia transvalensis]MBF6333200.1 ROK family protein [Nocardia transvalensis]